MPVEVVAQVDPHACDLPGWRQRRRLGVRCGTIVCCTECDRLWVWEGWEGGVDWFRAWAAEKERDSERADSAVPAGPGKPTLGPQS